MASVENVPSALPAESGNENGRQFDFAADTFAFPNELVWEYRPDPATQQMTFHRRDPGPTYSHRCFVLVRAARQFFFHARFAADEKPVSASAYRTLIRAIVRRNPRQASAAHQRLVIPGFTGLRALSLAHPEWLKAECGPAWHSYILRSHWRMVLPISREHQAHTAYQLAHQVRQNLAPIIHLVKFPALTINHGMSLFDVVKTADRYQFTAYDPNQPAQPVLLTFDQARQTFQLAPNSYWPGGELNVIQIYRHWWM